MVLRRQDGPLRIVGIHAHPEKQSLRESNRFTFAGKRALHYLMFGLTVAVALLVLVARVLCFRTPTTNLKRCKDDECGDWRLGLPDMPNIFNMWTVNRIRLNTVPWVELQQNGRTMLSRKSEDDVWSDIAATDAWNDDDGRGSDLLQLSR